MEAIKMTQKMLTGVLVEMIEIEGKLYIERDTLVQHFEEIVADWDKRLPKTITQSLIEAIIDHFKGMGG